MRAGPGGVKAGGEGGGGGMVLGQGVWVGVLDCDDVSSSRVELRGIAGNGDVGLWSSVLRRARVWYERLTTFTPSTFLANLGPSFPSISLRGHDHSIPFRPLLHYRYCPSSFHVIMGEWKVWGG